MCERSHSESAPTSAGRIGADRAATGSARSSSGPVRRRGRPVGPQRDDEAAPAAPRADRERAVVEAGEGDDLDAGVERDLGEGAVGDDERGPGHRGTATPRRLGVRGSRTATAPSVTTATPSTQRSQRGGAAVDPERADVVVVGDVAARDPGERARARGAASAATRAGGGERDAARRWPRPRRSRAAARARRRDRAARDRCAARRRVRAEHLARPRPTRRRAARLRAIGRGALDEPAQLRRAGRRRAPATCDRSSAPSSVGGGASSCGPTFDSSCGGRLLRLAHAAAASGPRSTVRRRAAASASGLRRGSLTGAPSSRDRRVAALTASRIAARSRATSSSRRPAAVVPPGDVTAARSASGPVVALREQRGRAEQRLHDELLGDVAREPDEHAGFDHRLGDEEDVRRARARQTGDRVERRLADAHDDADRAEQPLGEIEVLGASRASRPRSPTRRGRRARACSASRARPADRARALRASRS